jgi:hypothetical protein
VKFNSRTESGHFNFALTPPLYIRGVIGHK